MKTLGKKSLASVLKILLNIVWVVQLVFFSIVFFGMILKFATSQEYTINGWPVLLPEGQYPTLVSSNNPLIKQVEVDVRKTSLTFKTQRDWRTIAIAITGVSIGFGICLAITYQLRKIFNSLTNAHPFVGSNIKRLRIIGLILVSFPPLSMLLGIITHLYVRSHFHIKGAALAFNYDLDLNGIVTGLVVLVIAEVFRIGVQLKEEQDLTI